MKRLAVLALAIIATQFFASAALADGVGAAPDSLAFTLTREGSAGQVLVLIAEKEGPTQLALQIEGQAAGWITLSVPGSSEHVETVETRTSGRAVLDIDIEIPGDTGNGFYTAAIRVSTVEGDLQAAVVIPIDIEVSGDAVVSGALVSTEIPPAVEERDSLRIVATVVNTGTVRVVPTVVLTVMDGAGSSAESSTELESLPPGATTELVSTITHTGRAGDALVMDLVVLFDSEVIAERTASVAVVEHDALLGVITHGTIELVESADPGGVARLTATFTNEGATAADIMFSGAVSTDRGPSSSVNSIRMRTSAGATETVELFVPIETDGTYSISGRWVSTQASSDLVTFDWIVGSRYPWLPIVGLFGAVALALAMLAVYSKSRLDERQVVTEPEEVMTGTP